MSIKKNSNYDQKKKKNIIISNQLDLYNKKFLKKWFETIFFDDAGQCRLKIQKNVVGGPFFQYSFLHIHFGQVGPVGTVADPTKPSQRLEGQATVPAGR